MNKKIWDLYAPIYELAMRADKKVYKVMYERIPRVIEGKVVLEIAKNPVKRSSRKPILQKIRKRQSFVPQTEIHIHGICNITNMRTEVDMKQDLPLAVFVP